MSFKAKKRYTDLRSKNEESGVRLEPRFLEQIEKTGLTIQTARAPQARDIGHKQTVDGNHLLTIVCISTCT